MSLIGGGSVSRRRFVHFLLFAFALSMCHAGAVLEMQELGAMEGPWRYLGGHSLLLINLHL